MQSLQDDLQGIDLQLTECNQDLSNLEVRIDEVFVMCCNLVSLWKNGTLATSQKLQNLLFPDGIFWDKEIGGYRTEKENSALAVMRRITSIYKNEKEEKSVEISSLSQVCARRDSNPHDLSHKILSLARLPITPRALKIGCKVTNKSLCTQRRAPKFAFAGRFC